MTVLSSARHRLIEATHTDTHTHRERERCTWDAHGHTDAYTHKTHAQNTHIPRHASTPKRAYFSLYLSLPLSLSLSLSVCVCVCVCVCACVSPSPLCQSMLREHTLVRGMPCRTLRLCAQAASRSPPGRHDATLSPSSVYTCQTPGQDHHKLHACYRRYPHYRLHYTLLLASNIIFVNP
jgi:hypothetical protein